MKSRSKRAQRSSVSALPCLKASEINAYSDSAGSHNVRATLAKPHTLDTTMRTHPFTVTGILLACTSASAGDIFVDNVLGDDRRGGTTAIVTGEGGGPCLSIAKALRIAQPGDRIVVA